MDVDTMESGHDFVEAIQRAVGSCDVLIAVIGPEWLTVADKSGRRRIEHPEDVVRLEVATALERKIRVVPLLVRRATMPGTLDLPTSLAPLARRNALEVSDTHFRRDVDRLVDVLERLPGGQAAPAVAATRRASDTARSLPRFPVPLWGWGVVGVAVVGVLLTTGLFLSNSSKSVQPPVQTPSSTPATAPASGSASPSGPAAPSARPAQPSATRLPALG